MDDDLFVVGRLDKHRQICISPLSTGIIADVEVHNLGGGGGYFIYEVDDRPIGGGINVLAKAASLDAAFRLIDIWRSLRRDVAFDSL